MKRALFPFGTALALFFCLLSVDLYFLHGRGHVQAPRAQGAVAFAQAEEDRRPVVLVHGFGSSAAAWQSYLGPDGFLAAVGLQGFAVGDGQVEGTMNTGLLSDPTRRTNTIAENAAILGQYVKNVKQLTGASQVDLIAHSMGGLISRYYIDRVMEQGDVAQLIMLGSPQEGTDCANLPSSLRFYLPAALEIRPSYVRDIFNRQITHRHGVPFHIVAGTPILEEIQSPCTAVPSDLVISLASAGAIEAAISRTPALHTDLNASEQVFTEFIKPLLLRPAREIVTEPDPEPPIQNTVEPLQFTRVFTGHVAPGTVADQTIHIDAVTVATFALFDASQSLTVTVRGASGNVIELAPDQHGLIVVDDPETLVYLGYGFENPKPGPWRVTLHPTEQTPPRGTDFALTARFVGGAVLEASSSALLPAPGEQVDLVARLTLGGEPLPLDEAVAAITDPQGAVVRVPLINSGDEHTATWQPVVPGLHAIDVTVRGASTDGSPVERAAFLNVEVQPSGSQVHTMRALVVAALTGAAALGLVLLWKGAKRRRG